MTPKVLFVDIETAPIEGYTWQMFDCNVVAVKRPTYMLAWAAKWQGEKKTLARILPDYVEYVKNPTSDKSLVTELHGLFCEADIIIAHNADFDLKKANSRFLANGLPPPSPSKAFCTLKLARKIGKFDSNKLDTLGGYLGVGRKLKHTGINLWLDCMAGDMKAWAIMRKYNTHDVSPLLEGVFNRLVPYAPNFPDKNMWGWDGCPVCMSHHVTHRGYSVSRAGRRQRFQCQACGHWFSLGKAVKSAA